MNNKFINELAKALDPTNREPVKRTEYPTLSIDEKVEVFFNDVDALAEILLEEIDAVLRKNVFSSEFEKKAKILEVIAYFLGRVKDD